MKYPTVSIVMSVYNGEKYLNEAIESILCQTFEDFKFIIINDGSTDNTSNILNNYHDKRIIIINNSQNIGLTNSLNIGIKISKGKYIARMDADDISIPERIEKQVQLMEKNENIAILGTDYYPIDELGRRTHAKLKRPHTAEEIKKSIFLFNPFIHSTLMIRKAVIEELGGYDERFELAQDYELALRILSKYDGYNLPEELVAFRIDKDKVKIRKIRRQIYFAILARLKALKNGLYPKSKYVFIIKDVFRYFFPYYSIYRGLSKNIPAE